MNGVDILLLSVALAMDCFAVSIVSGVLLGRRVWQVMLLTAFWFGLFQGLMPLIGWGLTNSFEHYIEAFDHWVAFALLGYLGISMIREAFEKEKVHHYNPCQLKIQLIQAVATSIDAMAVGISFSVTGYHSLMQLSTPLLSIGLGSFLFSIIGFLLGIRFGSSIRSRLKPELLGGIILLFIGFKILLSHIFGI